ncbi:MAG: DMT family transporter [Candidatus Bathyarchaeia archaeon]
MIGVILALITAFIYGLSVVLIRERISESNYLSVAVVLSLIGNIILWPLTLTLINLRNVNIQSIPFFIIAGIFSPGIGRIFYYKGMEKLGVSINASIYATYPLFSSILATLLLGEIVTPNVWLGIIAIMLGVIFIERSIARPPNIKTKPISRKGLIFPFLASIIMALSYLSRKYGLNICSEPLLGVTIGYSSALLSQLLVSRLLRMPLLPSFKDIHLFWRPGVLLILGWTSATYALNYEKVSVITTIIQVEPLFILFLTFLKLRELERISTKVVIGTILIVIGVSLVTLK